MSVDAEAPCMSSAEASAGDRLENELKQAMRRQAITSSPLPKAVQRLAFILTACVICSLVHSLLSRLCAWGCRKPAAGFQVSLAVPGAAHPAQRSDSLG